MKEVEVPFEIPESWAWTKISITTLFGNFKSTKGPDIPNNSWVLDMEDLEKDSGKIINKVYKTDIDDYKSNKYFFEADVVLYGKLRPYLKKVAVADEQGYCTTEIFPISTTSAILPSFLRYTMLSPFFTSAVNQSVYGVKMPRVGTTFLAEMLIPLPPIDEQGVIIRYIEVGLDKVDEYAESYFKLEQLNKSFPEKLRKSILQYAMQGKLVQQDLNDEPVEVLLEKIRTEKQRLFEEGKLKKKDLEESIIYKGDDNSYYPDIPDSWRLVSLSQIGKITSGGTPKTSNPEYYNGNLLWITPADMGKQQKNIYLKDTGKQITSAGLSKSSAQLINANSIVYSSRAPIGHINIVPVEFTTNQGCKSVSPYIIDTKWLYFALKSVTPNIQKRATGTTFQEISASGFGDTIIGLCNLNEQRKIVKIIMSLMDKVSFL